MKLSRLSCIVSAAAGALRVPPRNDHDVERVSPDVRAPPRPWSLTFVGHAGDDGPRQPVSFRPSRGAARAGIHNHDSGGWIRVRAPLARLRRAMRTRPGMTEANQSKRPGIAPGPSHDLLS